MSTYVDMCVCVCVCAYVWVCVHMHVACHVCVCMCMCTFVNTHTCVYNKHCLPYQLCFGQSVSFICLTENFPQYQPANLNRSSPQKNLRSLRKADTSTHGHLMQIDIPSLRAKYAYKQGQASPYVHSAYFCFLVFRQTCTFHWHILIRLSVILSNIDMCSNN